MGPAVFAALTQVVALFIVFAYVYRRRPSVFLRNWTIGWGACVVHSTMAFANVFINENWLRAASFIAAIVMSYYLLRGTILLGERRFPPALYLVIAAAMLWTVGTVGSDDVWMYAVVPGLVISFTTIATGVSVWRFALPGVGRSLAAGALVLWGLHQLTYPLALDHPKLAPWGFMVAAMLEMLVAIGFFLVDHEHGLAAELRTSERLRVLFDNLPLGVYETTPEGSFRFANPALLSMLGYASIEELSAVDIGTGLYVDNTARTKLLERTHGEILLPTEVEWRRQDGESIRVVLQGRRVRNGAGGTEHFEGIVRDVTESRRTEELLSRAQRMESLGRLAGGVAHDFNNLLTVIRAATDLLSMKHSEETSTGKLLADIDDAAKRATKLTRNLLTVARGRVGTVDTVDVGQGVRDASRMLSRILEGSEVRMDLEDGEMLVAMEDGALDQVLLNTAVNARDAMPGGGVFTVSLGRVELGYREATRFMLEEGPYVRLDLHDNGHGMSEDTRRKIFEPFYTTRADSGGTGLGLATVYSAVERSDGRIDVDSKEGMGTTFTILWPRAVVSAQPSPAARRHMQGRRVMVIDDEATVLAAVGEMLGAIGYEASLFSPQEVDTLLADGTAPSADLILTDVILGRDRSGADLAARINVLLPRVPVLFMSGYPADELGNVSDAALLSKPFTSSELKERLEQYAAPQASISGTAS